MKTITSNVFCLRVNDYELLILFLNKIYVIADLGSAGNGKTCDLQFPYEVGGTVEQNNACFSNTMFYLFLTKEASGFYITENF